MGWLCGDGYIGLWSEFVEYRSGSPSDLDEDLYISVQSKKDSSYLVIQ